MTRRPDAKATEEVVAGQIDTEAARSDPKEEVNGQEERNSNRKKRSALGENWRRRCVLDRMG
jgi:hypothetical protein